MYHGHSTLSGHHCCMLRLRPSSANSDMFIYLLLTWNSVLGFPALQQSRTPVKTPHCTKFVVRAFRYIMWNPRGFFDLGLRLSLGATGPCTPGPSTLVHRCVRPPRWVWSARTPRSRSYESSTHSYFHQYSLIVGTFPSWTTASTVPIVAGVHDDTKRWTGFRG